MLKARNRKLSMLLVLAMLMTMFVGVGTASAASSYAALSTPVLSANTTNQNLGIIQVDITSGAAVKAGDVLTLSLPSSVTMKAAGTTATITAAAVPAGVDAATGVEVFIPAAVGSGINGLTAAAVGATAEVTATKTSLDITFGAGGTPDNGRILLYIEGVDVGAIDGDVVANMLAPANSAFTSGTVVVGRSSSAATKTVSSILSVKTIGNAGGLCDVISIAETAPNTLKAGEIIKVKLPNGFTWGAGAGTQSWGWATTPASLPTVAVDPGDARILNVTVTGANFPSAAAGLSGRVNFAATINVNDSVAKLGDITARVYSLNGDVTETDLLIAKYGTYGVTVSEGSKKELLAGKHDQKIGDFFIAEDLAGSLIGGRTIKLSLPKGVKWSGSYSPLGATVLPAPPAAQSGTAVLGAYTIADSNSTLKTVVTAGTKSKFKFSGLKVDIAPDFVGPIVVTVSGDATASGEIEVAEVKPAVEISAENIKDVKIGEQAQELGTIVLTETRKENIALRSAAIETWDSAATIPAAAGNITLTLPGGAEWAGGFPTVEVVEGDLQLKTSAMAKAGAVLTIPVSSASTKPSTVKISGLKATLYRTVPEGKFEVTVAGTAINETGGPGYAFPQYEDNSVAVANCVTPAPGEIAGSGQFKISSNIYYVGGAAKVMDVAPYIKDSRTYVPMRYVGEILGAEVVWDDAARSVTLTKGDDVVVFTIGSTSYTVNGEAMTADVAPEIANSRTMLPARFVAEAFGALVGWDAGTQTVLIQK